MSYGHAAFLAYGPRCGCGAPAFVVDDATDRPACARCARRSLETSLAPPLPIG